MTTEFTGLGENAGKCKEKSITGRAAQKKHLRETHKVLEDEITPLLEAAFRKKTRGRPTNASKEDSPLQGGEKENKDLMLKEIQSKLQLELSDESGESSDEENVASSQGKNTEPLNTRTRNTRNFRNEIIIDFDDSDDD